MNQTFSIGNVLATGFKVWGRNLVPFLVLSIIVSAPVTLWGVSTVAGEVTMESLESVVRFSKYSGLANLVVNVFLGAAITYGVVASLRGAPASIGSCIVTGLTRFFPALAVGFLATLAMIAGFVALIIPGIIITCMLYVSTQVSVVEKPGVLASLHRSRELTKGHRHEVFGILLLLGVLGYGAGKLTESLFLRTDGDMTTFLASVRPYLIAELVRLVITASVGAVMAAVTYSLLRAEKDGTSADELARVFE